MSGMHDCGGDAAAYALGALEPREADAFREHLRECAVCRDEVQALGAVVHALPMTPRQYEVPRGLRRKVLSQVREERRAPRRRSRLGLASPLRGVLAASVAAAAAVAVVLAGVGLSAGAPATVVRARTAGITGSAQLRVVRGHAELVVRHLTPPGRGRVYEVWLQSGTAAPVSASVLFTVDASGNADVGIPGGIRHVSAVLVTPEPLGGTAKPTHAPVIIAHLA